MTRVLELSDAVLEWITAAADSDWIWALLFGFVTVDGVLPVVPSESIVVSLGALWSQTGAPNIVAIALVTWAAAFCGDNLAYLVGRKVGVERFRYFREGRGASAVERARHGLDKRALPLMMVARWIPAGRVAVHMTAGAIRFSHRTFVRNSIIAGGTWAIWSAVIGAVAGSWVESHPLLGILVAMAVAIVLSLVIERIITWFHRRQDRRDAARAVADAQGDAPGHARGDAPAGSRSIGGAVGAGSVGAGSVSAGAVETRRATRPGASDPDAGGRAPRERP